MNVSAAELFAPLRVKDSALRALALRGVLDKLGALEKEAAATSPGAAEPLAPGAARSTLFTLLPTVSRLTVDCPFDDVREACSDYLASLRHKYRVAIPPPQPSTSFIPAAALVDRGCRSPAGERVRPLLESCFLALGRVSNLVHVLAYHPTYVERLVDTFQVCLFDDGPIPLSWRQYIALMACARHQCTYLVRRQQDLFLAVGGDRAWLREGLACPSLPPKLAALAELNALLAHRPWLLSPGHIKALTQAGGAASWSVNELVHATVIMTVFHSLCSLAQALGLNREPDSGALVGHAPCKPYLLEQEEGAAPAAGTPEDAKAVEQDGGATGAEGGQDGPSQPAPAPVSPAPGGDDAAAGSATAPAASEAAPAPYRMYTLVHDASDVAAREGELLSRLLGGGNWEDLPEIGVAPALASVPAAGVGAPLLPLAEGTSKEGGAASAEEDEEDDDEDEEEEEEEGEGGWALGRTQSGRRSGKQGSGEARRDGGASEEDEGTGNDNEEGDNADEEEEEEDEEDELETFDRAGAAPAIEEITAGGGSGSSASGASAGASVSDVPEASPLYIGAGRCTHLRPPPPSSKRLERRREMDRRRRVQRRTAASGDEEGGSATDREAAEAEEEAAAAAAAAGDLRAAELQSDATVDIADMRYRDFDPHEGGFVTHDFSWEEHAYTLLQRFYPAAAPALDKEFNVAFNLTYRTFGTKDAGVDTEPLRQAIWYYIQRLYGVRNDHYDYRQVNHFLPIMAKTFCKKVACAPETVTLYDFNSFTTTFTADEKVHIVMLVAEARRQASLLYGLHAIMKGVEK